jgi:hypothetical protein
MDTHQWLFEDFWVLVDGRGVHRDTVSLPHEMFLPLGVCEFGIFLDVADHEHTAGQAHCFLAHGVCKQRKQCG